MDDSGATEEKELGDGQARRMRDRGKMMTVLGVNS